MFEAQQSLDTFTITVSDTRSRRASPVGELGGTEPLRPLPAFPAEITVDRTASRSALVLFETNKYSVPPEPEDGKLRACPSSRNQGLHGLAARGRRKDHSGQFREFRPGRRHGRRTYRAHRTLGCGAHPRQPQERPSLRGRDGLDIARDLVALNHTSSQPLAVF
jgi:hypothetical protein